MAFTNHSMALSMRPLNKEWERSNAYDDLFNQYIDIDLLNLSDSSTSLDRIGSEDFSNIFHTAETSSPDSDSSDIAQKPWNAKDVVQDFWTSTLRSLEVGAESAAHSDFLSLGGFPSPHISSPTSPSEAARQRGSTLNNRTRWSKPAASPKSPRTQKRQHQKDKLANMMSASCYSTGSPRARTVPRNTGSIYTTTLPFRTAPLSPPPSAKSSRTVDVTTLRSPSSADIGALPYSPRLEGGILPENFVSPGTEPYTPNASPLTSPGMERLPEGLAPDASNGRSMYYAVPSPALPTAHTPWALRQDDMKDDYKILPAPLNAGTPWALRQYDAEDDYEISPSFNPWLAANGIRRDSSIRMSIGQANMQESDTPLAMLPGSDDSEANGLMISYDPTFTTDSREASDAKLSALPSVPYPLASMRDDQYAAKRSPSPAPESPRARRRMSKQRIRRRISTPKSPRGASASAFVNFTASDSAKLLTGVAPSGSSKTKARREKEAAERRRKFSIAAVNALQEAGGDVGRLRDVLWS
ncbi:hypothetical protein AAFC00_007153 [Neodothiora populina]|uniref:Developmental regulatory protein wetA n=1 Tax=Neodothiora populina TaxID=2781224 RepID=A0ABR3PHE9_9PEZI